MSLTSLPSPNFTGADLSVRVNAMALEARAARRLATVAALLADTTLGYVGGRAVAAGDIIEAGGHRYTVAASAASDHHVATAGGVRLYVQPGPDGRASVLAFGADPTGVADATAAFNTAARRFRAILVPDGDYRVNNANWSLATAGTRLDVLLTRNARLRADNTATDIINFSGQVYFKVQGGRFLRGAKAFNLGTGSCAFGDFVEVEIGGAGAGASDVTYGFWGDTVVGVTWERCVFGSAGLPKSVDYGIYFTNASVGQTNNNAILDCRFMQIAQDAITFAQPAASGVYRANQNRIIGGIFEDMTGHAIYVGRNVRDLLISGIYFEDCGVRSTTGTPGKAPVLLNGCLGVTVDRNSFVTLNRPIDAWVEAVGGLGNKVRDNVMNVQLSETRAITGASQANPVALTITAHGYITGDRILVQGVAGMTEINNRTFKVTVVDANTVTLDNESGTGFSAYTSGGTAYRLTPLLKTSSLFSDIDATGNILSNNVYTGQIVPFEDILFNSATAAEARQILFNTFANTSVFTGDEVGFSADNFGHVQSRGVARAITPTITLAAQDTWVTVARVEFPLGHSQTLHAKLNVFVGGSTGGALTGHSIDAWRKLYRTSGGSFRSDTMGTDFTTGAGGAPGASDFQVQVVLDAVRTNIALVQVRRVSGGASASFISPLVRLDVSNVNSDSNRIRLLQAG